MMPEQFTLEQLIALNPDIDKDQLEQSRKLRNKLRANGTKGAKYGLASPFVCRRVAVGENADSDPRTIHLKHPQ